MLIFLSSQLTLNSMMLASLILFLDGLAGLCFGLFLSVVTQTVTASLLVSQNFVYPTNFVSGNFYAFKVFQFDLTFFSHRFHLAD